VVERLRQVGAREVRSLDGVIEEVVFPLPKGLGGTSGTESEAHYAVADDST
jgi:4-hydroxy-3-methylbut-2-enyl diphosphate reductase